MLVASQWFNNTLFSLSKGIISFCPQILISWRIFVGNCACEQHHCLGKLEVL